MKRKRLIILLTIIAFCFISLPVFAQDYYGVVGFRQRGKVMKNLPCQIQPGMSGEYKLFCDYKEPVYFGTPGTDANFYGVGVTTPYGGGFGMPYGGYGYSQGYNDGTWGGIAKGIVSDFAHTAIGVGANIGSQYMQGKVYNKFYNPYRRSSSQGKMYNQSYSKQIHSRNAKTQGRGW